MRHLIGIAVLFGALVLGACSGPGETVEPSPAETEAPSQSAYFDVTVTGSGPDIILMPGLASSGAVWDHTVAALQDRFTLHVIQVNGFAGAPASGNAGNDDILDDLADGLSAYVDQFESAPTLIGHSLGGLVAMKTALQSGSKLDQLVIVDVLPFFSVLMDPAATPETIAPVATMMKANLLSQSDELFAERQEVALRALVKDDENLQKAVTWSVDSDRAVMAQAMSEVLVTDLRSELETLTVPTLIVYAKDDMIPNMATIETYYQDLYASVPDHRLVAIEGALHFVMLDQPEAFLAAIEAYLDPGSTLAD